MSLIKHINFGQENSMPVECSDIDFTVGLYEFDKEITNIDNDEEVVVKLNEIKNHIDKFGVSEELLNLFGDDLDSIGITKHSDKEEVNSIIDSVIKDIEGEVSEEIIAAIGVGLLATTVFFTGIYSRKRKALVGLIANNIENLDIKFNDLRNMFEYADKNSQATIEKRCDSNSHAVIPKYDIAHGVLTMVESCLDKVVHLTKEDIYKFSIPNRSDFLEKASTPIMSNKKAGFKTIIKSKTFSNSPSKAGWNKNNVLDYCDAALRLKPYVDRLKDISKVFDSMKNDKSKITKERAIEIRDAFNDFSTFIRSTFQMVNFVLHHAKRILQITTK